MATININIDDILARQFNENCSKKGITAQDAILKFIKKSNRKIRFPFSKTRSLEKGKNSFYALRKQADQIGMTFSDSNIEEIVSKIRAEN